MTVVGSMDKGVNDLSSLQGKPQSHDIEIYDRDGRQISADKSERIVTTLCPRRITRSRVQRQHRSPPSSFMACVACIRHEHNCSILPTGINIPKTRGVTWRILGTGRGIPEGSSKFLGRSRGYRQDRP